MWDGWRQFMGIIWKCSSCSSSDRYCAKPLQKEHFSVSNLNINWSFHIAVHRLKGLFVPPSREQNFITPPFPCIGGFMEEEGFKECETILLINAGKWHILFFLLLPFYYSSCCQSVRKSIYSSSNLSRWWVTKHSETFLVFLHVPSMLYSVCILTVTWLSILWGRQRKNHDLRRPQQNLYGRFPHHN